MANLFKAAKEKAQVAEKKSTKDEIVINDSAFHGNISKMVELNKKIDELAAESKILNEEIRSRSIDEFVNLYEKNQKFPGSFNIRAIADGAPDATYMFIPVDRYISIDKDRYEELQSIYGEEIVEESTTYSMNSELVEKYGEVLSDLIENCSEIDDRDKMKLISAVSKFSVRKGTISNLPLFENHAFGEILENIKPVYQIKNVKVEDEVL
jgi:hypothetical protein